MSCFGKKHTDKQPSMHIDAAESMAESGAVSGGTAVHAAKGYKKLGEQVRLCEASWSNDCYRVASGECHPEAVSLVGISGPIRNSQLLYGDMCAAGYGISSGPDEEAANEWWSKAAEAGSRAANNRLKSGGKLNDSMMHDSKSL